ncbi:MAG: SOS response-associated peptidase [Planctomycetota bacterium]|jgi:putative SOS response-associated peptidase YedK
MCGRFQFAPNGKSILVDEFGLPEEPDFESRINLAPTQAAPVVFETEGQRRFESMRWGLVPSWAREGKAAAGFINARVETAHEKPSFRDAWRRRRCLVLSTGYYEWAARGGPPTLISSGDGLIFSFAGLWEAGRKGSSDPYSCTILTTQSAPELEDIHPRMPVILNQAQRKAWLQDAVPGFGLEEVPRLAMPMETRLVSRQLNKIQNDDASCLVMDPQDAPASPGLFD